MTGKVRNRYQASKNKRDHLCHYVKSCQNTSHLDKHILKINPIITLFWIVIMRQLKTTINLSTTTSTKNNKNQNCHRGRIFQEESLSSILFLICLNHLSTIIKRETAGFKFKNGNVQHTHFYYTDYLKIFATTENVLQHAITEKFSIDIRKELGTKV